MKSGNLPQGITMSKTGVLEGTALTQCLKCEFTVIVYDSAGQVAEISFEILQ